MLDRDERRGAGGTRRSGAAVNHGNTPPAGFQAVPPPPPGPPPGWYTDPNYGYGLRWWDGHSWTAHYQGPPPPQQDDGGLVAAGLLFAVLMPIVGVVIGIVAMAKNKVGAGVVVVLLSVAMFFVWSAVFLEESGF